jgi:hypothetical protein
MTRRIKAIYRTVHGDIAVAYRMKKDRPMFLRVGKTGGYLAYVWKTPKGQKLLMPEHSWPKDARFIEEDYMLQTFLEKLQAFGQSAKAIVLFVLAPIFIVAGGIFYLLTKNRALQTQITELNSNKEVIKDEVADSQATTEATTSLDAYRSLRQQYLASKKSSGSDKPN